MKVGRRDFLEKLFLVTGSTALVGCAQRESQPSTDQEATSDKPETPEPQPEDTTGSSSLLEGLDLDNFILHNPKPLALESIRAGIGMGAITAVNRLFVRNNLPSPDESIIQNKADWSVSIEGVAQPKSFAFADLKRFPYANLCAVLQCSGNGRAFFKHGPSGSQWATGAAGCVIWGGVRLSDVMVSCGGAVDGAAYITATGGEELPKDVLRDKAIVERSIPLEKGLRDCLIAWEMNGEPIPLSHGGPVRFVVPGYFGCNQIKYVKRIAATKEQSTAKIQSKGYRFRPIGEKGNPSQESMWRMPVKSWIVESVELSERRHRFHGVAFSGERGVAKVEYSIDGEEWLPVSMYGPDLGVHAWRVFQIEAALPAGVDTIYTRAIDTAGDVQPKLRVENERGYGNNSWLDHGFNIHGQHIDEVAMVAATEVDEETMAAGKKVFEESMPSCGTCHTLEEAGAAGKIGPSLDQLKPDAARVERAVSNGVGAMPSFGESLTEEQIKNLAKYVERATHK